MSTKTYPNKRLRRYLLIPILIATVILPLTSLINQILSLAILLVFVADAAFFTRPKYDKKNRFMALCEVVAGILLGLWIIFN